MQVSAFAVGHSKFTAFRNVLCGYRRRLLLTPAAVFWLGYQFCFGHLGASSDRDLASPGLLGVRWDGPAGGTTFRDPVAEPRAGSRSRAYVCGCSPGGGAKVAPMTQVRSLDETSPGGGACYAPPSGRKNGEATEM